MFFKKRKSNGKETDGIIITENASGAKIEGYNRLRDNILFLNADGNNKVIQVESSVAHEGKTTVATNLAVSLGLTDKKVVVVDLDFHRPNVHRFLGTSLETGLAEYVLGQAEIKDVIKKTEYKHVDIISRGAKIYNSSVVFISDKFKTLIKKLREDYDYVILDCAPILQVSDYINISQVSDGVLFLVAYGMTTRNQVSDAIKELNKNNTKILGTVFTMYDRKKSIYGENAYYGKGYYSYYRSTLDDDAKKDK
ncbi:MAG: CpsD/CapB family tyrosine-protein kinase [Clostridia bacterium]|nr:CpsD/CapB family tyrosine-protein kinase [Clostridia bacterium]